MLIQVRHDEAWKQYHFKGVTSCYYRKSKYTQVYVSSYKHSYLAHVYSTLAVCG